MSITPFIWGLLGLAIGGILGFLSGLFMADEYWKRKICPYCDPIYEQHKRKQEKEKETKQD